MISFETAAEAQAFVRDKIDVPVLARRERIGEGILFRASAQKLHGRQFTNIYDISYRAGAVKPALLHLEKMTSVYNVAAHGRARVTASGGFCFLADQCSGTPRQLVLNLSIAQGRVRSLPVADREAILCDGQRLRAEKVPAFGMLSLDNTKLSWAGSLTTHTADCLVFGNGNSVIRHEHSEKTGSVRVLDEASRFTPKIEGSGLVDIGFTARDDGVFISNDSSTKGGLDIFSHDVVIRCRDKYLTLGRPTEMRVHTVGPVVIGDSLQGAVSVGPMLEAINFDHHPINKDASLGGKPPFLERPLARMVLYETTAGMVHLRLFDGRPGSDVFPGVTPGEAVKSIREEEDIVWGCFLDPGQASKLCIRTDGNVASLGNNHYLKWPDRPDEKYTWEPHIGRPIASMLTLQ